jgi:hypothetical protein
MRVTARAMSPASITNRSACRSPLGIIALFSPHDIRTLHVKQDAEKVRQHRSRIVQTLNVPLRVRLGPSLAAALLNGLFEHPAGRA